jgi:hypothetical protein
MINAKFIARMLAMALVFGMIGCDTGTNTVTKEVPVAGPGSTTTKEVEGVSFASDEAALAGYLSEGDPRTKPIYVVDDFEVKGNLTVPAKKTIIITDDAAIRAKAVTAGVTTKGSNAPQNRGVLFAINGPVGTTPTLTVKGRLTVASSGSVVLGSANPAETDRSGKLLIADTGKVLVAPEANIAVTTASRIVLTATNSVLTFEDTNKENVTPVGTLAPTDKKFGTDSDHALIIIPDSGNAATNATESTVGGSGNSGLTGEGAPTLTVKSTATADAINGMFGPTTTTVTYTGEDSLTSSLSLGDDKTLIIDGALTVGAGRGYRHPQWRYADGGGKRQTRPGGA